MDLTANIAAALAAIPDDELRSLRVEIYREIALAPELMLWLEAAAGWEMERRAGRNGTMLDPCATSDEAEVECNMVALTILRVSFSSAERVIEFLDATANALCGNDSPPPRPVH